MQNRSLHDFLQVSINTQKFTLFASSLSTALASHDRQLQQHSKQLAQLRLTMEDRLSRLNCQLQYQKERFDKKRNEDSAFFNTFIQDVGKKYDALAGETRRRVDGVQGKIKNIGKGMQEDIIQGLKQDIQGVVKGKVAGLQEELVALDAQIKVLQAQWKKNISTQDFLLKNVIQAYQNKSKGQQKQPNPGQKTEYRQMKVSNPNKAQQHHINKNSHHTHNTVDSSRGFSLEQATLRQGRERRRRKAQQQCQQQNLQYASISAKIDSLQNRLTAKQNESLNKVLYANNTKNTHLASESSQQGISLSMDRIQLQRKNLQQNITTKLEHIQQIIQQKFGVTQKQLERLKNKNDVVNDQLEMFTRKLDKERGRIADLNLLMKKFQQKKLDEKMIDNLMIMIKRQGRSLEEQVQRKMNRQLWQRQHVRVGERLQILTQSVGEKADKQQIKRAFQFVQDKIKQIVLLLADDVQQQKEGAGRKLPFKCLSCDKELDNSIPATQRPQLGSRCNSSSNIRKKVRAGNADSR